MNDYPSVSFTTEGKRKIYCLIKTRLKRIMIKSDLMRSSLICWIVDKINSQ